MLPRGGVSDITYTQEVQEQTWDMGEIISFMFIVVNLIVLHWNQIVKLSFVFFIYEIRKIYCNFALVIKILIFPLDYVTNNFVRINKFHSYICSLH